MTAASARVGALLPPVHLPRGVSVTCPEGHIVAVTAADLRVGHQLAVEDFFWRNAVPPRAGDLFPTCSICGGPALRETRQGVQLHTRFGWR